MNVVTITGNVTREIGGEHDIFAPEGSEYTCLTISIANNDESRKNQQGEYENIPSFFDVKFWTKKPQHWIQRIKKGSPVAVTGAMKQETWQKDGQNFSKVVINAKAGQGCPIQLFHREPAKHEEQPF